MLPTPKGSIGDSSCQNPCHHRRGTRKPLIYIISRPNLTQLGRCQEAEFLQILNQWKRVEDAELVIVLISRRRYGRHLSPTVIPKRCIGTNESPLSNFSHYITTGFTPYSKHTNVMCPPSLRPHVTCTCSDRSLMVSTCSPQGGGAGSQTLGCLLAR